MKHITSILMRLKNAKIISSELIKPFSPTPKHLKTLKLSFHDQIVPRMYIPALLFYGPSDRKNTEPGTESSLLKQSLAETLARYYPLAGRLVKNSFVDCDDFGVQYLECNVQCKLSDFTSNPNPMHLHPLLPFEPCGNAESSGFEREALLAVKVTSLECGGLVIGVCVSHKLSDAYSTFMFLTDWAATCAHADGSARAQVNPIFDSAGHFPPNDLVAYKQIVQKDASGKLKVTKRFIFDKSAILDLKIKATSPEVKYPSRVVVVSTFIWQRIMAITQPKTLVAVQMVNLRPRMNPPLSTRAFGNLWWWAKTMASPSTINGTQHDQLEAVDKKGGDDNYYGTLVNKMRNAIKQVDGEFIKTMQSDEGQVSLLKGLSGQSRSDVGIVTFTSWTGFPIYEVDFGRGKPSWAISPLHDYQNMVKLMRTSDGEGVEAWVCLGQEDMAALERDVEFLSKVEKNDE